MPFLMLFLALILVCSRNAYAYLDPGTGSLIFQAVAAAFLSTMFAMRYYFATIRSFFAKLLKRSGE
jgi:hypothetical protein